MLDMMEQGKVICLCADELFPLVPKTRAAERRVKVVLTCTVVL